MRILRNISCKLAQATPLSIIQSIASPNSTGTNKVEATVTTEKSKDPAKEKGYLPT
jgi:hypothetical protein